MSLPARRFDDHAKDAAVLLGWFGMTILMIGAPLIGVLSRRAVFVLMPVGAGVLFAGMVLSASGTGLKGLRAALATPLAQAALFLIGWIGLSLVWTPFPAAAAPRYVAMISIGIAATLIIAYFPDRRERPALVLLPAGSATTALLTLGMALFGPASFHGGSEFDSSLLERSVLTLVLLVWPALGALAILSRWTVAIILACLAALVIIVTAAPIALAAFAIGATLFATATTKPRQAARFAALLFGTLIIVAPAMPFALAPLAGAVGGVGKSTIAAMSDWRDLVTSDGVRLITGHGFDTARRGAAYSYLPAHTPRTILFEIWYELGLLGALGLAATFAMGFVAAGEAAANVAPALLAGMVTTLTVAVFGVATAQLWYVAMVGLQAVALGLLCRSAPIRLRPTTAGLRAAQDAGGEASIADFEAIDSPRHG